MPENERKKREWKGELPSWSFIAAKKRRKKPPFTILHYLKCIKSLKSGHLFYVSLHLNANCSKKLSRK
jgi:hypothetical protein